MAMWMWTRAADPPMAEVDSSADAVSGDPRVPCDGTSLGCNLELTGRCNPSGSDPLAEPHRRVICVLRGLWDVVDAPATDGDGIGNRSFNEVVAVMDSYWKLLPCNHCAMESYPWDKIWPDFIDGMNWSDFVANYLDFHGSGQAAALQGIAATNGLADTRDWY